MNAAVFEFPSSTLDFGKPIMSNVGLANTRNPEPNGISMHKILRGTLDFRCYDMEIVVNSLQFSSSGDYAELKYESSSNANYKFRDTIELGATAPGFNLVSLDSFPLERYPETPIRLSLNRKSIRFLHDSMRKPHVFIAGFWHEVFKGKQTDYYFSGLLEAEDAVGPALTETSEMEFLSKIQTKFKKISDANPLIKAPVRGKSQ